MLYASGSRWICGRLVLKNYMRNGCLFIGEKTAILYKIHHSSILFFCCLYFEVKLIYLARCKIEITASMLSGLEKLMIKGSSFNSMGSNSRILIWILEYMDGTCTLIIKCQLCGICSVTDDTNAYIPFSKIYSMFI